MFDITSSKLLLLGIVALLVIGPKDLPGLLRTIGKYMGMIKKQAADFRSQFDEAMRESELADLKKDMEKLQQETEATMRSAEQSVDKELGEVRSTVESSVDPIGADARLADPSTYDGLPIPPPEPVVETAGSLNGVAHADRVADQAADKVADKVVDKVAEAKGEAAGEPGGGVKTGA
jgi:sec-independent protein translocase protein TatB